MAIRNHTILRQEVAFAAGDSAIVDNLPVNPLSFIDIILRGTTSATPTAPTLLNILATLTRIEVLFRGSAVVSIDPLDLYALGLVMGWHGPLSSSRSNVTADVFRLHLRLSFSRKLFWTKEGFPASRAGELQIRYTPAAAFTNVATMSLLVETEEILDANFARFLKYTTQQRTPAATGESDHDLPIGNPFAGILLFGTSAPQGGLANASMREVRLLIDNQEAYVPRTRWDDLAAVFRGKSQGAAWLAEHTHLENTAAAYTQNATTGAPNWTSGAFHRYGFIDFDPLMDDDYLLPTAGRSSVKLRINADVADAQRIIPIELLAIPGAASAQ